MNDFPYFWRKYLPCDRCGADDGMPCRNLNMGSSKPMYCLKPHKGRKRK